MSGQRQLERLRSEICSPVVERDAERYDEAGGPAGQVGIRLRGLPPVAGEFDAVDHLCTAQQHRGCRAGW